MARVGIDALPRPSSGVLVPLAAAAALAVLTALPIAMLVFGSLRIEGQAGLSLGNYAVAYGSARTYSLFFNSFVYAFGAAFVAIVLGTGLALVVERTNTPLRRWFFTLGLVPLIVPGIVNTIAWIFLLSPQIGLVNRALMAVLGLEHPPFDAFSLGGMVWVEGLRSSPLVFLIMAGAFRSMDPALEESALTSGANVLNTLRRVTLPILLPALAAAWLIMFVDGLASFEVPALLGIPGQVFVFTNEIWLAFHSYPPDYGRAGALGVGLLVVSALGVWLYQRLTRRTERFATVTGKAYRPRVIDIGRWRFVTFAVLVTYFVLVIGLPLAVMAWKSFLPFYTGTLEDATRLTLKNYGQVFEVPGAQKAVLNSFALAFAAATGTMLLTAIMAWITIRTRLPGRALLDFFAFIPITIPGIVLGIALIWQYISFPLPIYGTLWILVIAYMTKYLPYGMRTAGAAMLQIHRELEEAASVAGAPWWRMFRSITLPLLRSGLLAGWVYILIVSVRELSASIMLMTSENIVIAALIFDLYDGGQSGAVAALSVMLIVALVVIVAIVQRISGRFGVKD